MAMQIKAREALLREQHMELVRSILAAIPESVSVAQAVLALEDCYVAAVGAIKCGLTTEAMKRLATEATRDSGMACRVCGGDL
jgi:hypothetical protein